MIVLIEGKLLKATPLSAIISAGGLGYAVNIPLTTAEKLPQNGEIVTLHTHAVYREDSQALYGFWEENDRDFFELRAAVLPSLYDCSSAGASTKALSA